MQRGRLIAACAAIAVVAVTLSWLAAAAITRSERIHVGEDLEARTRAAGAVLEGWGQLQIDNAEVLAADPVVRSAAAELTTLPRTPGILLESPATDRLRTHLQTTLETYGYLGFFVIDRQGMSLASTRDENTGTADLIGPDQPDRMQRVLAGESMLMAPQFSDVPLEGIDGSLHANAPTMFVTTPIRDAEGEVAAILALRIDVERSLVLILDQFQWGETGEILAVDRDGYLLNESRFLDELQALEMVQGSSFKAIDARDPGRELVPGGRAADRTARQSWPLTTMAQGVVARETAVDANGYRSYLGREVLGAWSWNDELGFAIVAEQAEREALAVTQAANRAIACLVVIALLLGAGLSWYPRLARRRRSAADGASEHGDRLYAAFEQWRDGMVLLDDEGRVLAVNAAACDLFGHGSADEGWDIEFHLPPPGRADGSTALAQALGLEGMADEQDDRRLIRAVRADGSDFPAEVMTVAVELGDRSVTMLTVRDLGTDLKVVRLAESLRELERVATTVSRAAAGPVRRSEAAMAILRSALGDDPRDDVIRELDALDVSVAALKEGAIRLWHDLTYASTPLAIVPVDLGRIVAAAAIEATAGRKPSPRIEVGELPTVLGDHQKLGFLFAGLLDHCVEAMASTSERPLTIRSEPATTPEGRHRIVVTGHKPAAGSPNGPGPGATDTQDLFEVFRTRSAEAGRQPGRTVGLAMCRELARRHGGWLDVEAGPNGDEVFVVELPALAQPAAPDSPASPGSPGSGVSAPMRRGRPPSARAVVPRRVVR